MPIKQSAMKALRQSTKRAERNLNAKATVDYLRRMQRKAIEAGDTKKAEEMMKDLVKKIDRAAQRKVLKKNTAARMKSRLHARLVAAKNAPAKEAPVTTKKAAVKKPAAKKAAPKKADSKKAETKK